MWALHWGMIKTTGDRRTLTPVETSGPGDSIEVLRSPTVFLTVRFAPALSRVFSKPSSQTTHVGTAELGFVYLGSSLLWYFSGLIVLKPSRAWKAFSRGAFKS